MTFYPGASPDVMASSVTAPLERQFGQIPGLNQMTSTSSVGSSVITLQFVLDLNIDVAEQEVQAAINAAANFLPKDLPNPPIYSKINPADSPILTLALTSDDAAADQSRRSRRYDARAENFAVARRGPGQHQRRTKAGGPHSGQSDALASLRLEPGRFAHCVSAGQRQSGEGKFRRSASGLSRSARTINFSRATSYRPLIIAYRNGAPVRLSDVANVVDGAENAQQAAWMNEHARRHSEHSAAARREHHRGGRSHQETAAAAAGVAAGRDPVRDSHRPHDHDSRVGRRRAV